MGGGRGLELELLVESDFSDLMDLASVSAKIIMIVIKYTYSG